jgi:putative hemolysin
MLAADITAQLFGRGAISISAGILTLVILIFGEVTPKQLAIIHNKKWTLHTARLVYFLTILLRPFIIVIGGISRGITRLSGGSTARKFTLDSVLSVVRYGEMTGVIESFKGRMVNNLFRLNDVSVSAILTHRTQVISIEKTQTIQQAFLLCLESGFSRLPVYDKDPERITGIALFRDISTAYQRENMNDAVKTIMHSPVFVSENKKVQQVFNTLKMENLNMVIVLDEYGGLAGIVTMEDVVEELFGELYDENEQKLGEKIMLLQENEYRVFADIPIYQFNEFFHTQVPETRDAQTIGGFLTEMAGQIPTPRQIFDSLHGRFIIERMARQHILTIRFRPTSNPEGQQSTNN